MQAGTTSQRENDHWRAGCCESGLSRSGRGRRKRTRTAGTSPAAYSTRYAPTSTIASRELRDLLGARVHFGADLAVFVTTTRFSRPSEKFALQHGILAVHRDHLGVWNGGASLMSLAEINGAGQGDARHRTRWKQAYSE